MNADRNASSTGPGPASKESKPWSDGEDRLSAQLEPFDSYWQAPKDVERGYRSFRQFYRSNYLKRIRCAKDGKILVVSCGPGYFVSLLGDEGYRNVLGIDSDPRKIGHAEGRGLPCRVRRARPFLSEHANTYEVIICEQELNHLTKAEILDFLLLARASLKPGGQLFVYGLNGANPITGSEALAQNIDHFNTFTEYSLRQALEISGYERIHVFPLNLYVFYANPLNYVGLCATGCIHGALRLLFALYGKSNKIFTKKIGAVCHRPANMTDGRG